ncbi:MAG: hypothetical protein MMC33_000720 [Icmadophila ericetorum]|nr:hypothetical protein [Icmadophila ericetorum]
METLRSTLQPITHNLPNPILDLITSLLGEQCTKTLLLDIDLSSTDCLKLAISKALGIAILGVSTVVKVPQLLKILSSRSGEGVSFSSYALETVAYAVTMAYNFRKGWPFSTYGETAMIAVQNIGIAALVLHFQGKLAGATAWIAVMAVLVASLFQEQVVPEKALEGLMAGAGALSIASKVPQILAIWQQGGTGQLSAFAVFNYLGGSLTRIFTTLQEVDDKLVLYGFIAGFLLNAVLAAQMLYYWNSPATASHAEEIGKTSEKTTMGSISGIDSTSSASASSVRVKSPTTRRRG